MRILLVVGQLDYASGVTTYLKNLVCPMRKIESHKIFIATSGGNEFDFFLKKVDRIFIITELDFNKRSYIKFFIASLKLLWIIIANKIQIVHSNDHYVANIARFAALFINNTVCVQTLHANLIADGLLPMENANFYVTVNKHIQEKLERKKANRVFKSEVVFNGIDPDQIIKNNRHTRTRFTLISVARLVKQKGVDKIFEALSMINEEILHKVQLIIVGEGEHQKELIRDSKSISCKILFLGSRRNTYDFFHLSDVFILSSIEEGHPYSLLEATLCGCFIICSNFEGYEHVFSDGIDGFLFDKSSSIDLKEKIAKAYNLTRQEREWYTNNYIRRIKEQFTAEIMANKTLSIYKQMLKK
jgi:glycosyltransferase involved in cell wall biosynthesis